MSTGTGNISNANAILALPVDPGSGSSPSVDFILGENGIDFQIHNITHKIIKNGKCKIFRFCG